MQIIVTPEDIIKRCLFDKYKFFVLKKMTEDDIRVHVEENKPTVISENDAYVIGLLRIVETENIVHRFNIDIDEILKIKSNIHEVDGEKKVLIVKSVLLKDVLQFKDKFPEYYSPDIRYKKGIEEVLTYINNLYKEFDKLETIVLNIKEKNITFVASADVKKVLKKYNNNLI